VLALDGTDIGVYGTAWMDHEFFDLASGQGMPAWDWFAIQLSDGRDIMLYNLRNSDGSISQFAAGTVVYKDGSTRHLPSGSFVAKPGVTWHSPVSGGDYPVAWSIEIPSESLSRCATTPLEAQELPSKKGDATPTYWDGAVRYAGRSGSKNISGVGYIEMTGVRALTLGK